MNNLWVWLLQHILPRRFWYRRLYMRSAHWQAVKAEHKRDKCENCGDENGLQIHHLTYYDRRGRSVLWREQARHLRTLCRRCHKAEHMKGK